MTQVEIEWSLLKNSDKDIQCILPFFEFFIEQAQLQ